MEAFQANITGTCPSAFGGSSGSLFAGAIAAVVAAHCSILDNYRWPKDRADHILGSTGTCWYIVKSYKHKRDRQSKKYWLFSAILFSIS